jgi:uncharacterized protein YndB with AHSA1/START domain
MQETTQSPQPATKDLILKRVFDAPIERVWKAMTDPQQVMRWWGPAGFSSPSCKMDLRVGGMALFCMRSPSGEDIYTSWVFTKIVPMERIEFIQNHADKDGNSMHPSAIGAPDDFPQDVRNVLAFRAVGNKTEITITQFGFPEGPTREFAVMGLNESLDKLAECLR